MKRLPKLDRLMSLFGRLVPDMLSVSPVPSSLSLAWTFVSKGSLLIDVFTRYTVVTILSRQNNRIINKMHPQIDQSMINIGRDLINPTTILAIMIALLLSACSSVPSSVAERDIDRSPPSEDTSTPPSNRSTQPVRNQNIERAEYYLSLIHI